MYIQEEIKLLALVYHSRMYDKGRIDNIIILVDGIRRGETI
jgi:hypothetical protein